MKDNKLTISINKSVEEVFAFTLNPKNTPLWIEDIDEEITNEWPPNVGTMYSNRSLGNERWTHYKLTAIEDNKSFTLKDFKGNYTVKYTFTPKGDDLTEFEYHEWTKETKLEKPFSMDRLNKLKEVLENS